jgi:acetylornithine/succinyldiaminopimelate/putrescine aminotransferase
MNSLRELFFRHIAQTSPAPLAFEVERAEGVWLYGSKGEKVLDLISGIAVSNVGHRHPRVMQAIREQSEKYLHTLVYGEMIQSPQVKLAEKLCSLLPPALNSVYFVNSGSEAVEGALKLAKRATGRHRIFSMKHAYHGSTHGALSVTGDAALKQGYGPMLPEVFHIPYNDFAALQQIDYHTAAVIVEGIQGEAGVVMPQAGYLAALRRRCSEVGALMILDEIQTGFGRTGSLFYLEQAGIVPDILTIAKGMGAGMPIGAFVSSRELMSVLSFNPVLGHITTFGGHPLSAAAALAGLEVIAESGFLEEVREKSLYLKLALSELPVLEIRGTGMMWALRLNDFDQVQALITFCMQQGLLTDWFLFASNCVRIAPPLVISKEEIDFAVEVLGRFFRGEH